jgi:hypothetical protein
MSAVDALSAACAPANRTMPQTTVCAIARMVEPYTEPCPNLPLETAFSGPSQVAKRELLSRFSRKEYRVTNKTSGQTGSAWGCLPVS